MFLGGDKRRRQFRRFPFPWYHGVWRSDHKHHLGGELPLLVIKLLFLLIIMGVGAGFAIINETPVTVDLYWITHEMPLFVLVLIALGAGILLGGIAGMIYSVGVRRQNSALKRKAKLVNEEVKNLRTMPVKER